MRHTLARLTLQHRIPKSLRKRDLSRRKRNRKRVYAVWRNCCKLSSVNAYIVHERRDSSLRDEIRLVYSGWLALRGY